MIIPTIVEKEKGYEKVYDLYSRLLKDRIIFLSGEITDEVSNVVVGELLFLNSQSDDDIYLYINSPGGSVTAGMAVCTICVGMCASMAAFLLSSGTKGKRMCLPNGEVMIHQPLGGAQGQATEIQIAAERIIKLKKKLNMELANNTGQKLNNIERDTERDHFMDASEALEYGIVDKILEKDNLD